MKCIQCKGLLFINLKTNELICNRCKFTSNPNDIIWKCIKCGEIHKNIVATDDDFNEIINLSVIKHRNFLKRAK